MLVELPVADVWKAHGGKEALSALSLESWLLKQPITQITQTNPWNGKLGLQPSPFNEAKMQQLVFPLRH